MGLLKGKCSYFTERIHILVILLCMLTSSFAIWRTGLLYILCRLCLLGLDVPSHPALYSPANSNTTSSCLPLAVFSSLGLFVIWGSSCGWNIPAAYILSPFSSFCYTSPFKKYPLSFSICQVFPVSMFFLLFITQDKNTYRC